MTTTRLDTVEYFCQTADGRCWMVVNDLMRQEDDTWTTVRQVVNGVLIGDGRSRDSFERLDNDTQVKLLTADQVTTASTTQKEQTMTEQNQVTMTVDGYRLDGIKVADTMGINGYCVIVSIFNAFDALVDKVDVDALMALNRHFAINFRLNDDVERQLTEFWKKCVE